MIGHRKPDRSTAPGAFRLFATVVSRLARDGHLPALCPSHAFEDAIVSLDNKGLLRNPPEFTIVAGRKRWPEAEQTIAALSLLGILGEAPGAIPCIDEETVHYLHHFEVPDLFVGDEEVDRILRTFLPRVANPANGEPEPSGSLGIFGWLVKAIFGS